MFVKFLASTGNSLARSGRRSKVRKVRRRGAVGTRGLESLEDRRLLANTPTLDITETLLSHDGIGSVELASDTFGPTYPLSAPRAALHHLAGPRLAPDELDDAERSTLQDGLEAFQALLNELGQHQQFSQPLQLLGHSLGDRLELGQRFGDVLVTPLSAASDAEEMLQILQQLDAMNPALTIDTNIVDVVGGQELRIHLTLDETFTELQRPMDITFTELTGSQFAADANYHYHLEATFGLTPAGSERTFFTQVDELSAGVTLANPTHDDHGYRGITTVDIGPLDVAEYHADLDVTFNNPDGDSLGRLSRNEILGNSLATLVGVQVAASDVQFRFPVATTIGAYSTTGAPALLIHSNDPFAQTEPGHTWNDDAAALTPFHTVTPLDVAERLQSLANWFDDLTETAPLNTSLPFVPSLGLNDLVDLGQMFEEAIGQHLMAAPKTPNFASIQELAELLSPAELDYNPLTRVMTIALPMHDTQMRTEQLALGFNITGVNDFETSATVDVVATTDATVRFGIDLTPLGTGFTLLPTTPLTALNAGVGVPTAPGADLIIRFRDGGQRNFDVDGLSTVGDLLGALNADPRMSASINGSTHSLVLTDMTQGNATFRVDLGTSLAAGALGLFGADDDQNGVLLGMPLHGDRIADHFYLEELAFEGDLTVSGSGISAAMDLLGVELTLGDGSLELSASFSAALIDPGTPNPDGTLAFDGRINASELADALVGNPATTPPITASSLIDDPELVTHDAVLTFQDIEVQAGFLDVVPPDAFVTLEIGDVTDLSTAQLSHNLNLADFPSVDVDAVLDLLRDAADAVHQMLSVDPLQFPIPLVNQRLSDLFDPAETLRTALDGLDRPGVTLANLQTELPTLLGVDPALFSLEYDEPTQTFNVTLEFDTVRMHNVPVELDIASLVANAGNVPALQNIVNLIDTSGSNVIGVNLGANLVLAIGLDVSNPENPVPFVRDSTHVNVTMSVSGTNLEFQAAVGPLGVFISDGQVTLDIDGNGPTDNGGGTAPANLQITLPVDHTDHRYTLGELPAAFANANADFTGGLHVDLPIYFPTAEIPLGGVGNNSLEIEIDDLAAFLQGVPDSVEISSPDLSVELDQFALLDNLYLLVDGFDWLLGKVQNGLNSNVLDVVLPFLGDQLRDSAQFVEDLRQEVVQPLSDFLEDTPPTPSTLQQAFFNILGPVEIGGLGLLGDFDNSGTITPEDVSYTISDSSGDGEDDDVLFEFDLSRSYVVGGAPIGFDIGLPALGLDVMADVEFQLSYDWHVAFGVSTAHGFYLDTTSSDELQLGVEASIPGFDGEGRLGFLQLEVADQGSALSGAFIVDFTDADGRLTMSEFTSGQAALRDIIDARLEADADVNLGLRLSFGGNPVFPSLVTDFAMHWDLATVELGGNVNIGGTPEIAFNNVGIDLGSFISDFATPLIERLSVVLDPMKPVVDALQVRVPVLSDIDAAVQLLDTDHDGEVNLIEVASELGIGGDATEYISDFVKIYNLYDTLRSSASPGPGENLVINIGDFDFGTLDVRNLDSVENVSLEDLNINALEDVLDQIPEGISQFADDAIGFFSGLEIEVGDAGPADEGVFKFPLFDDPTRAFGLLLGQDVELVTYDMRPLEASFSMHHFFPIFWFLGVEMDGSLGASADFSFGYDTRGFRDFVQGDFKDPLDILNGFYISDRENADGTGDDIPEIRLWGDLSLAAAINAVVASVSVGGGISANIDGNLNDVVDNDGKFRIDDLLATFPKCMLDISGAFTAGAFARVKVGIGELSVTKNWDIAKKTLASFNYSCEGLLDPYLATDLGNGDLRLNLGPFAAARVNGPIDGNDDEVFTVTRVAGSPGNETILVSAFGYQQEYSGVSRILAYGGDGDDSITISSDVYAAVELHGEGGNDVLIAGGGPAVLSGGDGDDELNGGASIDIIDGNRGNDVVIGAAGNDFLRGGDGNDVVYGDEGNDTILGESGADALFGGPGNDEVDGGADDDELEGEDGDDRLVGGSGNDTIQAGIGNDHLEGNSGDDTLMAGHGDDVVLGGDGADQIVGGSGNDELDGGSGNDELHGDEGNDLIYGNAGRDVLLGGAGADTMHGGSGNDELEGGTGADALYGDAGADTIRGDAGDDELHGGAGDDWIDGGDGTDSIFGDSGHDRLFGDTGDDTLDGGSGQDQLDGSLGNDTISGGTGIDVLVGGAGDDELFGNDGDDQLFGDTGNDLLDGGAGRDRLWGADGEDVVYGGHDSDLLVGGPASDSLLGGFGNDVIIGHLLDDNSSIVGEYIEGGPDDDDICGTQGPDSIFGGTADFGYEQFLSPPAGPGSPLPGEFLFVSCASSEEPTADFDYEPEIVDGFLVTTAEIRGHKRMDIDGNGAWDPHEPGLGGVTLFLDMNGNGQLDGGEPSTTSGIDGAYAFTDLAPGTYTVRELTPVNMAPTFPANGHHVIQVDATDVAENVDFANALLGEITGTKWNDYNGNGARDPEDGGIPNVVVYLDLDYDGLQDGFEPSTTTNGVGLYTFADVVPGNYAVREVVPNGFVPTFPAGYLPQYVQVLPGVTTDYVDFGNYQYREIRGVKWSDRDADGSRDANEPGVAGVTVYVDLDHDGVFDDNEPFAITLADDPRTESIDETGTYVIKHVPGGQLDVREIIPAGYEQSLPLKGSHTVDLRTNTEVDDVNFGNVPLAEIHGTVWNDLNGDGLRQSHEIGRPQVQLYLDLNNNARWDVGEPATISMSDNPETLQDETGQYAFTELPLGAYRVRQATPSSHTASYPHQGFHLATFADPGFVEELDFGNYRHAEIRGLVWLDVDGDRVRDLNEHGQAGVPVYADVNNNQRHDPNEPITFTAFDDEATSQNEAGTYVLSGLVAGPYTIRQRIPYEHRQSFPLSTVFGGDGMSPAHRVTLREGEIRNSINFGLAPTGIAPAAPAPLAPSADLPVAAPSPQDGQFIPIARTLDEGDLSAGPCVFYPNEGGIDAGDSTEDGTSLAMILARLHHLRDARDRLQTTSGDNTAPAAGAPGNNLWDWGDLPGPYPTLLADNGPRHMLVTALAPILGVQVDSEPDGQPADNARGDDVMGLDDEDGVIFSSPLVKGQDATVTVHAVAPGYLNAWLDVNGDGDWLDGGEHILDNVLLAAGPSILNFHVPSTNYPGFDVALAGARFRYSSQPGLSFVGIAPDGEVEDYVVSIEGTPTPPWDAQVTVNNAQVVEGNAGTTQLTFDIHLSAPTEHPVSLEYHTESGTASDEHDYVPTQGVLIIPAGATLAQITVDVIGDLAFEPNETLMLRLTQVTGAQLVDDVGVGTIINDDSPSSERLIEGYKWRDSDADGIWDAEEHGEAGFVIYADLNTNGRWDLGEPQTVTAEDNPATVMIDEAGYYQLGGLPVGMVSIREIEPEGWTQSFPLSGHHVVNVVLGATVSDVNFGNSLQLPDGDDLVFAAAEDDVVYGDNHVTVDDVLSVGTRRDTLYGEAGRDRLLGQERDDVLSGGEATDVLHGGEGIDRVVQTVNADQVLTNGLLTGQGPDTLLSIERATLTGGDGNNTIDASAFDGPVILDGGAGDDHLIGTIHDDQLAGGDGSDIVEGLAGDDEYLFASVESGVSEIDTLVEQPGDGADTLDFSVLPAADHLTIDLAETTNVMFGQHLSRQLRVSDALLGNQPSFANVLAGGGDDVLIGNDESNRLVGGDGDDQLHGGLDQDILEGDAGNDVIDGGAHADVLHGGLGDDWYQFTSQWGADILMDAGGVDDHIDFSALADSLDVNIGPLSVTSGAHAVTPSGDVIERVTLGSGNDHVRFAHNAAELAGGNGVLNTGPGTDLLDYSAFTVVAGVDVNLATGSATGVGNIVGVEDVTGGAGADTLIGDGGANHLIGRGGRDLLVGGDGDDVLEGGLGNDELMGGRHNDLYLGGIGNDIYRLGLPVVGEIDELMELAGQGSDTLDLQGSGQGVELDMTGTTWIVPTGGGRQLNVAAGNGSIEAVLGTGFNDRFVLVGSDLLVSGGPGDDEYVFPDGSNGSYTLQELELAGSDHINFQDFVLPVTFDLSAPINTPAPGLQITTVAPSGFEILSGGAGDDHLLGSQSAEQIFGGEGSDTIEVQVLDHDLEVDGGSPGVEAEPGDTLIVDAQSQFVVANAGSITSPGQGTIHHVEIETVRTNNATELHIGAGNQADDGASDLFEITVDGSATVITVNGAVVLRSDASQVPELVVHGSADDDHLVISFENGNPIPQGITYHGRGQVTSDGLEIIGGQVELGLYQPSTETFGNGTVWVDSSTITFTGLEPVVVHGLASLTFSPQGDNDTLVIDSPVSGRNRIFGTSGGVSFEEIIFFDVPHITIDVEARDANNGVDNITFADDLLANGLRSLVIRSAEEDTIDVSHVTTLDLLRSGDWWRFVDPEHEGDFDQDGEITDADIDRLAAMTRETNASLQFDLTNDGVVDLDDLTYLVETVKGTLLGDANLDFQVDAADLQAWNDHRFQEHTGWSTGDWNGDGVTDGQDVNLWNRNKFRSANGADAKPAQTNRAEPRAAGGPGANGAAVDVARDAEGNTEMQKKKYRRKLRSSVERRDESAVDALFASFRSSIEF